MPRFSSRAFWVLPALLLGLCVLAHASGAQAGGDSIPVKLNGKELVVTTSMDYTTLCAALQAIFAPEAPSLANPERVQYDVIAVQEQAPVTVWFDFDKKGKITAFGLVAMDKAQNPWAAELKAWLELNAGPGVKKGKALVWKIAGFTCSFKEVKNAGEDSYYGVEATRK
jgi:hypothetical protein